MSSLSSGEGRRSLEHSVSVWLAWRGKLFSKPLTTAFSPLWGPYSFFFLTSSPPGWSLMYMVVYFKTEEGT